MQERLVIKILHDKFLQEILQKYPYIYKPMDDNNYIILSGNPKEDIAFFRECFGEYRCYCCVVVVDLVNKTARLSNIFCRWVVNCKRISYDELLFHLLK